MPKKSKKSTADISRVPVGKLNNLLNQVFDNFTNFKSSKKIYIAFFIIIFLLLAFYKKSWFVAATINGAPITGLELQMRLNQQFKSQLLNQLINEKIILIEAGKIGAIPAATEIDQKISELETNVGGSETLDNLLLQQGQTRVALRDQVKIQLAISKMYDEQASVSAKEVNDFIKTNSAGLQATDSASQQKEAYDFIKQQKISEIFSKKFQELRTNANIVIF